MGSLYIMVVVPSNEHEKTLWLEKAFRKHKKGKSMVRPNKSTGNMLFKNCNFSQSSKDSLTFNRSISNDSVLVQNDATPKICSQQKKRAKSATQMDSNKDVPMEKRLEQCLKELKIPNAVWTLGRARKYYQVSFCTPAGEQCERIIQVLNENEIGIKLNSTVSVLPCSLYYEGKHHSLTPNKASPSLPPKSEMETHGRDKELSGWEWFVNSVRARLMVAQVVAGVKSNAVFTFDFLILLIIASMTAAVGLVENSVVILVASVLISPLLGPVMASTFGFVTRDWRLQNIGVLSEVLGLLLCVLIGFLYGLTVGFMRWEAPDIAWPTPEMVTRGDLRSLWVGTLIALLSGAAVAIAVLGNYSGSLTGVAISASLMPPAVNAGLLWAVAAVLVIMGDNPQKLTATALRSKDPVYELLVLGARSMALTFINIICIFITGIIVLKIKEVAPRGSKDYSRLLWKETIQIARDYKYNMPEATERMEHAAKTMHSMDNHEILAHHYRMGLNQYTWSAYGAMSRPDLEAVWPQLSVMGQGRHLAHTRQQTPSPSPGISTTYPTTSHLWNTSVTSYGSCDPATPVNVNPPSATKRFIVTPADIHTIDI